MNHPVVWIRPRELQSPSVLKLTFHPMRAQKVREPQSLSLELKLILANFSSSAYRCG